MPETFILLFSKRFISLHSEKSHIEIRWLFKLQIEWIILFEITSELNALSSQRRLSCAYHLFWVPVPITFNCQHSPKKIIKKNTSSYSVQYHNLLIVPLELNTPILISIIFIAYRISLTEAHHCSWMKNPPATDNWAF